ncbi:hypothetical protein MT325_m084L [Paramecium bursaria chlorella virus MT325]|uniref:Uncharacterized protein m084L n=1 Tax=Paramecium bursaria Chlorella virus MT325 TaxID=346932 RepID=A7ITG4_PBCVM|nr:hypothetical protein MT325_m084L [Paramecium bursaria chlorella virus MT325]
MSLLATTTSTVDKVTSTAKKATADLTIRFADLIVTAAGIVAALSWNTAIQSLFAEGGVFYRFAKGGPWVAATVITIFAVWLGFWRTKLVPPTPVVKK